MIHTSEDGLWTGELNGRVGQFKFIYVEMLKDEVCTHTVNLCPLQCYASTYNMILLL